MLCPSVFQPAMRPFLEVHWPICSLWPETGLLFYQMEQDMLRHLQEMRHNMEYMERLHQKIFEEINLSTSSSSVFKPISFQVGRDRDTFSLTLDTKDFSLDELSVKQVGRNLYGSGWTEKKQGDGRGSYSYRCQELRQEVDLPLCVDPETVTCSLVGGQLLVQAPRQTGGTERVIPISFTLAHAITQTHSDTHSDIENLDVTD